MSRLLLLFSCLSLLAAPGLAQTQPLAQREVRMTFDSGDIVNDNPQWSIAFSELVEVPEASWLRLYFKTALLGKDSGGKGALLRITSVADGASQTLDAVTVKQWRRSSAYFNGDAVVVEILTEPGMSASRVQLEKVIAGEPHEDTFSSICGPTDDRELSSDPRSGRLVPIGCSVWLIDDENKCFLTAGHCLGTSDVVEFNVPLSNANGTINHPPPEDQYIIDVLSVQSNGGQGIGNDYAYFGTFPNANTNLTAAEAQGSTYILGEPPADPTGQNIRITGYGSTSAALAPNEWNQVQKTHLGPLIFSNPSTVNYQTDTTGGNSGSPIIHEETGEAIGIHTHAGCSATSGNNGTNILFGPLQDFLANPLGVCKPPSKLAFSFPNNRPELISTEGGSFEVQVTGINGGIPSPGTGMFLFDLEDGSGVQTVAMTEISPNLYRADIPAADCGARIVYDFSAEADNGQSYRALEDTPGQRFVTEFGDNLLNNFRDNFETDNGWTVEDSPGLTDGSWERGVPAGGGTRQDPPFDADGSGSCFLTDNVGGNSDVDGGNTVLVSPVMDATQGDAHISYRRWFYNSTSNSGDDVMVVEISSNGGTDWQVLETVGPTGPDTAGGWIQKSFRIADFIAATDQFRIRFDVSDLGAGSIVEAGIDDVRMNLSSTGFACGGTCVGDVNNDGVVDQTDINMMIAAWGNPTPIDLNSDGNFDILDLIVGMDSQGACP